MNLQKIPFPPGAVTHEITPLDARLSSALPYLRHTVMADVGTDHAYLPLYALANGLCTFAVATDIHRKPAELAAANLARAGFGDAEAAVLWTDGLCGAESYGVRDVCIFGMGGETIVHVLREAPFIRNSEIRLILQPMTHAEILREYLCTEGFAILDESLYEEGHTYQTLCAAFDGIKRSLSPLAALVGAVNLENRTNPLLRQLLCRLQKSFTAARDGKRRGNASSAYEDAVLAEIEIHLASLQ